LVRELIHKEGMMIHLLLPLICGASTPASDGKWEAPSPTVYSLAPTGEPGEESDGKWSRAGVQFLSGTGGAALGAMGGAFVGGVTGYIIGEATSDKHDRCEGTDDFCIPASLGTMIVGGMVGAGAFGAWSTAAFVRLTAPDSHPSSGIGPALLGSIVGTLGGLAIIGATSNSMDWQFLPGFAVVMASSSAGAVVFDRGFAKDRHLTLSPWVPRPGLEGAKLSMAF